MLLNPNGRPEPPSGLIGRLQEIDPDLGIRWLNVSDFDLSSGGWAITAKWPKNDSRHELIQSGAMSKDDDFDMVCHLPSDCTVDSAYGFVVNNIKRNGRDDVKGMLLKLEAHNAARKAAIESPVMDEVNEKIESHAANLFKAELGSIPKSFGGIAKAKKGKKK